MNLTRLFTDLGQALFRGVREEALNRSRPPQERNPRPRTGHASQRPGHTYPGDFRGRLAAEYRPTADGRPDPGEVCWAWIPYEDDPAKGKDRPALIVGQDGPWLLALPLTSKDHDRDARQEAAAGRHWMDVGTGAWDKSGRPSEVRLDRVVRIPPGTVRREGAALDRSLYDEVISAAAALR